MRRSSAVATAISLLALAGCGERSAGDEPADAAPAAPAAVESPAPAATAAPAAESAATPASTAAPAAPAPATPAATPAPAAARTPAATRGAATPTTPAATPAARTADAAHGRELFARCSSCHGPAGAGTAMAPTLVGVVGRRAGAVPGYAYSDALKASGLVWTPDNLKAYIAAPRTKVPGTKMMMSGPKEAPDQDDLIAYLASLR